METETAEPASVRMRRWRDGDRHGMKISVARDELVAKLGVVSRAVSTRGTVQVLSGILLRVDGAVLTLAATDMELSLRTTLDAQVEGDGAVVIPGKPLVELARLLPESDVTIEYRPEEGTVQIVSGSVQLAPARLQRRGLPAATGRRRAAALDRPRGAARDRRPRRTLGVPRRVAPSADRDPRSLRDGEARDGRYRLLPALGEGDRAGRCGARARGDHSGARADGAVAPCRRRHRRTRRPREPCRLRHGPATPPMPG